MAFGTAATKRAAHGPAKTEYDVICTSCGHDNSDTARFCPKCGRKLQSFCTVPDAGRQVEEDPKLKLNFARLDSVFFRRCFEAWTLLLMVAGGMSYGLVSDDWLPMYVLMPMAGLIAWLRKL